MTAGTMSGKRENFNSHREMLKSRLEWREKLGGTRENMVIYLMINGIPEFHILSS